ncbi:hypothetical protein BJX70DRAFT_401121 [Aspergillus crustosus]
MCIYYTTKYLCSCIYDEWFYPCKPTLTITLTTNLNLNPDPNPTPRAPGFLCPTRELVSVHDVLTLCEPCFATLHTKIKKQGIRDVLDSGRGLGKQLGMLIVLENDEKEQWRAFRRGRQVLFRERWSSVEACQAVVKGRRM